MNRKVETVQDAVRELMGEDLFYKMGEVTNPGLKNTISMYAKDTEILNQLIKQLEADKKELQKALLPFAKMHRPGCDLEETTCQRGAAFDGTFLTSQDFYNAAEALGISGDKEAYDDAHNEFPDKIHELYELLKN